MQVDVTKSAEVEAMVAAAKERWGGVHILINNAGILRDKSFAKMSAEDFKAVIDVHLTGSAELSATDPGSKKTFYERDTVTPTP